MASVSDQGDLQTLEKSGIYDGNSISLGVTEGRDGVDIL